MIVEGFRTLLRLERAVGRLEGALEEIRRHQAPTSPGPTSSLQKSVEETAAFRQALETAPNWATQEIARLRMIAGAALGGFFALAVAVAGWFTLGAHGR